MWWSNWRDQFQSVLQHTKQKTFAKQLLSTDMQPYEATCWHAHCFFLHCFSFSGCFSLCYIWDTKTQCQCLLIKPSRKAPDFDSQTRHLLLLFNCFLSPPIIHMDKTWQDYATMRSSFYQLTDWPHLEPPSDHSGLRIISTCAAHLLALVVERTMPGGPSLNVLSLTNSWRKRGLQVVAKQSWKHQFRSK